MFGGLTQLLAGLIQLRTGHTIAGVLFCGFDAFWLSLLAIVELFLLVIGALFALAAGNYGAHADLVHVGGYLGLGAAALALYLSRAETCGAAYGCSILPVWPLNRADRLNGGSGRRSPSRTLRPVILV